MKTITYSLLLAIGIAFAQSGSNTAYDYGCDQTGNLPGSCFQNGYVCNIGFDVNNAKDVLFFSLGVDSLCTTLNNSNKATYLKNGQLAPHAIFFMIEDEHNATPLSMTTAGALALSASVNRIPVEIMYNQVDSLQYGGLRLRSIRIKNTDGL